MTEYKFTREDVGCYLDGHYGWHNTYRVIELAQAAGFQLDESDAQYVSAYRDQVEEMEYPLPYSPEEWNTSYGYYLGAAEISEAVQEISNDATDYLQSVTDPELAWVWDAGELSLMTEDDSEI